MKHVSLHYNATTYLVGEVYFSPEEGDTFNKFVAKLIH